LGYELGLTDAWGAPQEDRATLLNCFADCFFGTLWANLTDGNVCALCHINLSLRLN